MAKSGKAKPLRGRKKESIKGKEKFSDTIRTSWIWKKEGELRERVNQGTIDSMDRNKQ